MIKKVLVSFFILIFCSGASIAQISWDEEILKYDAIQDSLSKLSRELGFEGGLGSIMNEFNILQHKCQILGLSLNVEHLVSHLDISNELLVNDDDPYSLMLNSLNASNWIHVAKNVRRMSNMRRIRTWNLECVGRHDIDSNSHMAGDDNLTFYELSENRTALFILGPIEKGFYGKVLQILNNNPKIRHISIGGKGGLVYEAMLTGLEIRKRNIETLLQSNCYSACALVYIGGSHRMIWSPYYELGFSQMEEVDGESQPINSDIYDTIKEYSNSLSIDGRIIVNYMQSADGDDLYTPSLEELCKNNIVNWAQRFCTSN